MQDETVADPAKDEILFSLHDGIATVTFNRPAARNALTFAMYERLTDLCALVERDRSVRAMVLTGAGPSFRGRH